MGADLAEVCVEVFNITNTPRLDVNPNFGLQSVFGNSNFGVYSASLTQPRIQQFSLRAGFLATSHRAPCPANGLSERKYKPGGEQYAAQHKQQQQKQKPL